MGRFVSGTALICVALMCGVSISCSSGSPTKVSTNQVPAVVTINPSPNVSLDLGKTQTFISTAQNSAGTNLAETFTYESSNPSVVTVSSGGLACAGTWDSLTAPTLCTPGQTGVAQVTSVANGVSSLPVNVYVHQHVTGVVIRPVPGQPPTMSTSCFSSGAPGGPEHLLYQAMAFNGNTDITSSVGPFTWGSIPITGTSGNAVALSSAGLNAPLNQEIASANVPGTTSIFASASGANSQALKFTTCPVQTITISAADGSPNTTFVTQTGTSTLLKAVATDSLNMPLTNVPLTWSSSNPVAATVTLGTSNVYSSTGNVTSVSGGGTAVTASCTPPNCNGGFSPSIAIYPPQAMSFIVQEKTPSTAAAPTVFATTSDCNNTTQSCTTRVVPITRSGTTSTFAAGTPLNLPSAPNSFRFGPTTTSSAFLGIQSSAFGTQQLMSFSGSAVSQVAGAAGRVLAVAPNGSLAVIYDSVDSPNRIFIVNGAAVVASFQFSGATAAAFSPESTVGANPGYKAYVVSSSSCPGTSSAGCLLVYSQVDAARLVPLSAPATDVSFIGDGIAGYLAGGDPAGMSYLPTCAIPPSTAGALPSVNVPAKLVRALPDGQSVLALSPPDIQTVSANITLPAPPYGVNAIGCPAPRGFVTISNTLGSAVSLGQGTFTPTSFIVSPDGAVAYILGDTGPANSPAHLPFVMVYNIGSQGTTIISLVNNAIPLSAAPSPDGTLLFVGGSDNQVHVINTSNMLDSQQVPLTFPQASLCIGPGSPSTVVAQTSMTISAATQNGSSTTFTYALTGGPTPAAGQSLVVGGMSDTGNDGTFIITAITPANSTTGTVTVSNSAGATASGQNGTGTVPLACNPDLIAVKP